MIDETENLDMPNGYRARLHCKANPIENFPLEESFQVSIKKIPPPIPFKSNYLKIKTIKSESEYESEPESKSEPEPESKVMSLKTRPFEPTPEPIVYKNNDIEEMYINAKNKWERFGNNPENFDQECFITEIEELSNYEQNDFQKDPWHYTLRIVIQLQRD